jgi:hypothetical protein
MASLKFPARGFCGVLCVVLIPASSEMPVARAASAVAQIAIAIHACRIPDLPSCAQSSMVCTVRRKAASVGWRRIRSKSHPRPHEGGLSSLAWEEDGADVDG